MADEEVTGSGAPASDQSSNSSKSCTACKKPTKDHFGPYGKDRCVVGLLDSLRSRVDKLERLITSNEERHARELAEQEAIFKLRLDGLLTIVETLHDKSRDDKSCQSGSCVLEKGEEVREKEVDGTQAAVSPDREREAQENSKNRTNPVRNTSTQETPGVRMAEKASPAISEPPTVKIGSTQEEMSTGNALLPSDREGDASSASGLSSAPVNEWKVQGRRRRSKEQLPAPQGVMEKSTPRSASGLRGAERRPVQPFHLSGIDLSCTTEDVLSYCRKKGIQATACFMLPRRVHHATQSAKLFAVSQHTESLLKEEFWPRFMYCRKWESTPPRSAQSKPQSQ